MELLWQDVLSFIRIVHENKPTEALIEEHQSVYDAFNLAANIEEPEHLWICNQDSKLVGVLNLTSVLSCLI
jgi:transposase